MRSRKLITLLLSSLLAFTALNAFSAEKKNNQPVSKIIQKKTLVTQSHKAAVKKGANEGKNAKKKSAIKHQTMLKQPTIKANKTKKARLKKATTKKVTAKKITTKKATTKKITAHNKNNAKNNTKKQYGVKGATLSHVKVSNKTYRYREKGKAHTSIDKEKSRQFSQTGVASYYGGKFHGRKTASGEIFNKNAYTAAHKTLALGSYVLVTNLRNGRKVIVRINDRGPFSHSRIIDLSVAAAKEIGMLHSGIAKVKIEAMQVDKQGYISGKGAESLYKLAKNAKRPLKVKGIGKNFAIKAE